MVLLDLFHPESPLLLAATFSQPLGHLMAEAGLVLGLAKIKHMLNAKEHH